jgi:predicted nucleic acid-binding protein
MRRSYVVDATVIIAGLMADGHARRALFHTKATLFVPPLVFEKVASHVDLVVKRSRLPREVIEAVLADIRARLAEVPGTLLMPRMEEAMRLAVAAHAHGDEDYIALALTLDAPIWTFDKDFQRVKGIKVATTKEVEAAGTDM